MSAAMTEMVRTIKFFSLVFVLTKLEGWAHSNELVVGTMCPWMSSHQCTVVNQANSLRQNSLLLHSAVSELTGHSEV